MTTLMKPVESVLTLKDIANAAGLSIAAVSKVVNNREGVSSTTRERVLRIMEEMGYAGRAGKGTASRPDQISIVIPDRYITNDHFYGEIVQSVLDKAKGSSIVPELSIVPTHSGYDPNFDIFRGEIPRAVIFIGIEEPLLLDKMTSAGVPAVLLNGIDKTMSVSSVSPDYYYGAWAATQHLLELGHRDIVHITHPYRETIRLRQRGYCGAMESYGIEVNPDRHILDLGDPNALNLSANDKIARYLEARDDLPTALFCVNDMTALGAIQAVEQLGMSVPNDISVIGFDGLPLGAHSRPSLTTVRIERAELGEVAVDLLLERYADVRRSTKRLALEVNLVQRASTAPARK